MSICVKQYDINCCMHNKSMEFCENLSSELISFITVQATGRMFLVIWAVLSTLPGNLGDSRFGPYFLVSRSEYEISRIIAKVNHLFSRLEFPTIKSQLCCVVWAILMLTLNISSLTLLCHCNIKIWLVESKPIRSNATIPTSLLRVLFHRKFLMIRGKEYFFAQMTSSAMCYVIYHLFPVKDVGGWQPWMGVYIYTCQLVLS